MFPFRVIGAMALLAIGLVAIELPSVSFEDIAPASGLTVPNTSGGKLRKDYILETTGNGVAVFDYDGDGAEDIFIANGTSLDSGAGSRRFAQLYHNDGHGRFTEIGERAGFTVEGWGQGVCVDEYDNNCAPYLLVTNYGHNRL